MDRELPVHLFIKTPVIAHRGCPAATVLRY
jgi:hypothetical protein